MNMFGRLLICFRQWAIVNSLLFICTYLFQFIFVFIMVAKYAFHTWTVLSFWSNGWNRETLLKLFSNFFFELQHNWFLCWPCSSHGDVSQIPYQMLLSKSFDQTEVGIWLSCLSQTQHYISLIGWSTFLSFLRVPYIWFHLIWKISLPNFLISLA